MDLDIHRTLGIDGQIYPKVESTDLVMTFIAGVQMTQ